ncbi:MFS transporter [Virgibacillus halophilus]|uniref:MFS transporter n=1 Tax=Tigheibacillus halophilus TaxID=361280 RepID=A0ABU5C3W4_9BACI|nr:MFS transporter [Virgibacillus halophilus]
MVYFIYFLIIVTFVDTFSQLPIMSPFAQGLGASAILIGIIIGMYSFTNIAGNMISGYYIDRKGVKGILSIGLVLTGIVLIMYAYVSTPGQLLIVRFFHGLTGGLLVPAAFTYLANNDSGEKKGKVMALSGAGVGLASIIGPAYGGIISSKFGPGYVFTSIGILMIVTAVFAFFILPEKKVVAEKKQSTAAKGVIWELCRRPGLVLSYVGAFSLMFSQGIIAYALPLRVEGLGFDSSLSGILMSTFAITSTLIFILPTNRLYDRFSFALTMMAGLLILSMALIMLEFATMQGLLYVIMCFYGVGFALIFPSMTALVASNADASERGKAYGLFYGFFSLGVVAGAFVSGLFSETPFGVFTVGAVCLVLGVSGLWLYNRTSAQKAA